MRTDEIIRKAIPGASKELCVHILWGRTPFPCGSVTAKSLYKAAHRWERASKKGLKLCEFCNRPAVEYDLCQRCYGVLNDPKTRPHDLSR